MSEREKDAVTGTETTGHEWDGIKELNTPLPRWWLWTFYGTIVFALVYTVLYPAWPLLTSATSGVHATAIPGRRSRIASTIARPLTSSGRASRAS